MKSKRNKHRESNRARTLAVQELRRSGAAGTHTKKVVKSREDAKAIQDSAE